MSNRFFNFVTNFISGTLAKSAEVNARFGEVGAGFDANQLEMNTALRVPATENGTDLQRLPAAAVRLSKWLVFDAAGKPVATMTLPADMDAASHRLRNLIAPAANDEPVTLGYLTAYSGSLAGIPPLAGNNGKFLTTDGVGVQWTFGGAPSTVTAENGMVIVSNAGTPVWTAFGYNLLTDPQGIYGAESWTSTLTSALDEYGLTFTNAGALVTQTFDHKSAAVAVGAGVSLTLCCGLDTTGASAGTVGLLIRYLDGGGATLSESAITAIANGAASKRFMAQGVTPASTASVQAIVRFTGFSASIKGIRVRNPKLERGTVPTPFTDDTSPYRWRYTGQYNLGKGIVTVDFTLGDGTTTQSSYDLRSAAGVQAYDVRLKSTGGTNGTPGKGLATIEAGAVAATGPVGYTAELDAGNAGAALSINLQAAAYQKCTLNAATSAISFDSTKPPLVVGRIRLKILQDATGGRLTTWPTGAGKITVVWQGTTVPSPATGVSAVTFVDLYWDGTTLYGSWTPWS